MAVFRVNKSDDYTIISNQHFREKKMTLKAKGLLSLMLSLPDDWDYSIEGLKGLSKDGKDSLSSALEELKRFGYLTITKTQTHNGFVYTYDVYESPSLNQSPSSGISALGPTTETPDVSSPLREIRHNKELNSKDLRINDSVLNTKSKENLYFDNDIVNNVFLEFIADRKERKKPMSSRAIKMAVKKVLDLSNGDPEKGVRIIQQSIERGWTGLFPLNEDRVTTSAINKHHENMEKWRNA